MIYFEMFPSETVRKLHARRTNSCRVLRRIASITCELDISWDLGISLIFSEKDLTLIHVSF